MGMAGAKKKLFLLVVASNTMLDELPPFMANAGTYRRPMTIALETIKLTKKYTTETGIEKLSFSIKQGSILAYLGHNGAGKTTTIRTLLGLLKADSGDIKYFGNSYNTYSIAFDKIRREIGVCFDKPGFYPNLSAIENLTLFAQLYSMDNSEFITYTDYLLERAELHGVKNKKIETYSSGMKQKLGIIRAIMHKPKLVFLDEPMNNLDPAARVLVRNTICDLSKKEGVSFFIASHDLREIEQIATDIIILEKGKIKISGNLTDLQNRNSESIYDVAIDKQITEDLARKICDALKAVFINLNGKKITLNSKEALTMTRVSEDFNKFGCEVLGFNKQANSLEQIYFSSLKTNEN